MVTPLLVPHHYYRGLCRWPKCYHVLNRFFLSETSFLEFVWIFSSRNHLEINIFHQINSIKSCSSRSFQQHQSHIPIHPKFSATIEFNFQWRNHSIFKNFCTEVQAPWNQAHAPLLVKSFPKTPRTRSEASQFDGYHKYKTNYLPS
jgi:hypothetical protein